LSGAGIPRCARNDSVKKQKHKDGGNCKNKNNSNYEIDNKRRMQEQGQQQRTNAGARLQMMQNSWDSKSDHAFVARS
jgi:hypothetical protein